METLKSTINKFNEEIAADYAAIQEKYDDLLQGIDRNEDRFTELAYTMVENALFLCDLEQKYLPENLAKKSISELQELNEEMYGDIKPQNYETSYGNPEYCVKLFGEGVGQAISAIYISARSGISAATQNKRYYLNQQMNDQLSYIELILTKCEDAEVYAKLLKKINMTFPAKYRQFGYIQSFIPQQGKIYDVVMSDDLSNPKYLYNLGRHISANEIKTAEFLADYPQDKINTLAKSMANAYVRGFTLAKKDMSIKSTINVNYNVGQERIIRALIPELEKAGLKTILSGVTTTSMNRQYGYDHRFDNSLWFDEEYVKSVLADKKVDFELFKNEMGQYSGGFYFDKFGESPFNPKQKDACLKLSEEQQKLNQKLRLEMSKLHELYIPRVESSFCIIGFPVPEIGEKFEEIFQGTLEINMIDTEHHEEVQHHMIKVLDLGDFVHVKGKAGNATDIKVKMQTLVDAEKQTNFVNCGADVNIPVGELFTSPKLEGTDGVLHVKDCYLNDLNYNNLKLTFKDGYVTDYTCKNFAEEEKNRKYIEENLLFPHKTLPIGEFAIGTNTLAYAMAKKFDILPLMPILIVEKMGPHFAIGDTCFSWEEDFAVFNPIDGKEITARDNSKSILRKTDMEQAYTNCHTDITLPYEDLEFITVITKDGEKLDIIRDGRFVVAGTEELNEPLIGMEV